MAGLAAVAWAVAATGTPAAEGKAPDGATISLLAIRATTEDKPHCDRALVPIRSALAKTGKNSFRLILRDAHTVPFGKTWEKVLAEGYSLRVRPQEATAKDIKLTLTWVRTKQSKDGKSKVTELQRLPLTIRKAKYFLSGGWKLNSVVLEAAVSAE